MLGLDSVVFDTTGLEYLGDHDGVRYWQSDVGDSVALHFFAIPPDIPAPLEDADALRCGYVAASQNSSSSVIAVDTVPVGFRCGVRVIARVPQEPSGMTYVGTITLPFRDCSFVVKAQCAEHGPTGVREATVLDRLLSGSADPDSVLDSFRLGPEDPLGRVPIPRNLAEDECYDTQFPFHPLTRVRGILKEVQDSLELVPEVSEPEPFEYREGEGSAPSMTPESVPAHPGGTVTDTMVAAVSKLIENLFRR